MDVTKETFEASLAALDDTIGDKNFAFWSLDLEFTGLNADRTTKFDVFDTLCERWRKVHTCVTKFTVLQYGICCFSFCPESRQWSARPFNFWLFPDSSRGSTEVFSSQASSVAFLSGCGFDFNKCFAQGVPFTSPSALRRQEQRADKDAQRPPIVPTEERDTTFVENLKKDVKEWLGLASPLYTSNGDNDTDAEATYGQLLLPVVNGFLRALTYQTLENLGVNCNLWCQQTSENTDQPGFIAETIKAPNVQPRIWLTRASPVQISDQKEKERVEKEAQNAMKKGFTAVLTKLLATKKPAVGHNGLFDLAYTLEKFLCETDGGLAEARSAFATHFTSPYYDTKLIANTFMDVYASSLRDAKAKENAKDAEGTRPGVDRPPSISDKFPLDTALGPLYETLTTCALPAMLRTENESAAEVVFNATTFLDRFRSGPTCVSGDGDKVLDWLQFPPGFDRYKFALASPNGVVDVSQGTNEKARGSFAHEAGYDAFMTGVAFLTMTLHGRSVVDADGIGEVRVYSGHGAAAGGSSDEQKNNAIGFLGACPFSGADGSLPLQHSQVANVLTLRGSTPSADDDEFARRNARVVVLVGITNGLSFNDLVRVFVAAGLGVPQHVHWIRNGTVRATFPVTTSNLFPSASGYSGKVDGYSKDADAFATDVATKLLAVGTRVETLSIDAWKKRELLDKLSKNVQHVLSEAASQGVDVVTIAAGVNANSLETQKNKRSRFEFGELFNNGRNAKARRVDGGSSPGRDAKSGCVVS
jgi:hypothetical protein